MTLSVGYILESVYDNPQVVLIFLFFSAVFGLMIWSQASALVRLRTEQRTRGGSAHLNKTLILSSGKREPCQTTAREAIWAGATLLRGQSAIG
jgi:hypothetical protein